MKSLKVATIVMLLGSFAVVSQAPPSIDKVLKDNGIDTSRQSLIEALRNKKPEVRGLAAMQLAVDGDKSALPDLHDALSLERSGPARLNMARALKTLGDRGGIEAMIEICVNPATTANIRLMTAQEIPPSENGKCAEKIIERLAVSDNPVEIYGSLLFLANGVEGIRVPSEEWSQLSRALQTGITNTVPSIRKEAAMCIGKFGITSLKQDLLKAEAKENDADVTQEMRVAVQLLQH